MSSRVDDVGSADDEAYVESEEEAEVDDSMDEDDVHPDGRRSGRNAVPGAELQLLRWQSLSYFAALAMKARVHKSACIRVFQCCTKEACDVPGSRTAGGND